MHFMSSVYFTLGPGTACWLECRTRDQNVASSNPSRSGGRIFFSRVNFVCWLLFGVRSTPVLPQWHVKDPGYSAKSAGYAYTHKTPLNQRSRSGLIIPLCRRSVGIPQFTRSSSGNTRSRSSQESIEVFGNMRYCILQQTFFYGVVSQQGEEIRR